MSFLRLQQAPGFYLLTAYGFAHRNPMFDQLLEVDCKIAGFDHSGEVQSTLKVPLTDFALYPVGSTFGRLKSKKTKTPGRRRTRRQVEILAENELWHLQRHLDFVAKPYGRFQASLPEGHPVYLTSNAAGPRLGFLHSEPLRFLSSSVSLLLDTIAAASTTRPTSEELFMNAGESGMDGRQLILTPHRQFQNLTATLQMALMFTDPHLLLFFSTAYTNIRRRIAAGEDGLLGHYHFPMEFDFTIETERVTGLVHDGSSETVEICDRIVSDHRQPNFDELVIRVRRSKYEEQIAALEDQEEPPPDELPIPTHGTKLVKYPRPGMRTFRIASLGSGFAKRFPGFERVKVRFDYEFEPGGERLGPPRRRFVKVEAESASDGQPKHGGTLPRVRSGDIREQDQSDLEPPVVAADFLPAAVNGEVSPVLMPRKGLPLPMQSFLDVGLYLYDVQAHDLLPDIDLRPDEALLWELPGSWGRFSAPDSQGRPRLMAAIPLRFDTGVTWIIEILRRSPRDQFAMGMCSPRIFEEPTYFLSRLMFAVGERFGKRRGEELQGTWPRAVFRDVRIDNVRHSDNRLHARNLSAVLLARAHALVAPVMDI